MTFHPVVAGSYEAVLTVTADMMVSGGRGSDGSGHHTSLTSQSLLLRCVAEDPMVALSSSHTSSLERARVGDTELLDFGVLVGGATVAMALELVNRGQSKVPLQVSITSEVSAYYGSKFLFKGNFSLESIQ